MNTFEGSEFPHGKTLTMRVDPYEQEDRVGHMRRSVRPVRSRCESDIRLLFGR